MDTDRVLRSLGKFGRFQLLQYIYNLSCFPMMAFPIVIYVFIGKSIYLFLFTYLSLQSMLNFLFINKSNPHFAKVVPFAGSIQRSKVKKKLFHSLCNLIFWRPVK